MPKVMGALAFPVQRVVRSVGHLPGRWHCPPSRSSASLTPAAKERAIDGVRASAISVIRLGVVLLPL
jgi:hypothetical protein